MPKWVLVLAFAAFGCTQEVDDMPQARIRPWHMWGEAKVRSLIAPAVGVNITATEQMARVNYKRPETWSFFAWVKIVDYLGAGQATLTVDYSIAIGVGRSVVQIPQWVRFRFTGAGIPIGSIKWTSVAPGPVLDDSLPTPPTILQDSFVAEDIQVSANATYSSATPANRADFEMGFFLAPVNHVRPDWFNIHDPASQFPGNEDGGR